jgi:hypothetical protein
MGPWNQFQGMNSASLCSQAGRYDDPIPPWFLAPIDCLKIPAPVRIILTKNNTKRTHLGLITIYAPMIYMAPCVILLMRAASITWASGRGLDPGNPEFFWVYVKWYRADRLVPFGAKKTRDFQGPTPSHFPSNGCCPHQKHYARSCINHRRINSY